MNKILILVGNVVQLVEEDNFSDTLCKNWTCITDNEGDIFQYSIQDMYFTKLIRFHCKTQIPIVSWKVRTNTWGQSLKNYFW